ncbi:integrase [Lactobacillus delbrueckii]|uniref:site-specific integrase n=1 Tax=Lactobacillus delbrueckii TaxID=1584 RepID=UPI001F41AAE8|nr:site-specific integrase [Lactobacillus delbrueckii]GHN31109.1 integrase [Lactobacillus delbrueckii]
MVRKRNDNFCEYFEKWIETYKAHEVRPVTLDKWYRALKEVQEIAGDMVLQKMTRADVQEIVNEYGKTHAMLTVNDFTRYLFAPLKDAFHDQLINIDITYRVRPTSQVKAKPRTKFLERSDADKLCEALENDNSVLGDLCILLLKTGLRYSEALGLTTQDIDFDARQISVNKTFNYKRTAGEDTFMPTKNRSSVRTIKVDILTLRLLKDLIKSVPENQSIFVYQFVNEQNRATRKSNNICNSTVNNYLARICKQAGIPYISCHGLRHTHASLLIAGGASIQFVSERLGHANTTTTERVYIHLLDDKRKEDEKNAVAIMMGLGA